MTIAAGAQGHAPTVLVSQTDGYEGYAPSVLIRPVGGENPQAARYRKMWTFPDYRASSPGEELAQAFLRRAAVPRGAEVIDFGCGTGRGAFMLALFGGCKVTMVDFAENCLDPEVQQALDTQSGVLSFLLADLTAHIPVTAPYGFCCDVMEHVPEADVPAALRNILTAAQHVFFTIATGADNCGLAKIGEELHLTQRPMAWWLEQLKDAGAVIHWNEEQEDGFVVYCTAWKDVSESVKDGKLNVEESVIEKQTALNIAAGWQHAHPYDRQDREVVLLAGGPSTAEHLDDIRKLREGGAALVTLNGAYTWALAQGLQPSMQIVVDGREFNARFTHPVVDNCIYMLASQVHPKTLEGLPHARTFLWHTGLSDANQERVRAASGSFFPVPGGSTVALRAIPLLRMLGFWKLHVFGMDSCVWRTDASHHSYPQPENDEEVLFPVACGGRQFFCAPWMMAQASEFRGVVGLLGDEIELEVYGDGLIKHIIQTGAALSVLEEL